MHTHTHAADTAVKEQKYHVGDVLINDQSGVRLIRATSGGLITYISDLFCSHHHQQQQQQQQAHQLMLHRLKTAAGPCVQCKPQQ